MSALPRGPQLPDLYRLFAADAPLPEHELLPAEALPDPFRSLLVHEHHMTVTVEAYYGSPVDVVGAQFRDAIHGSEMVLLERAGHLSNMERPSEFNAHVRRFCSHRGGHTERW